MLRIDFTWLPLHHQKLYKLLASLIGGAFILGLIWVLLGFSDQRLPTESEWQATQVPSRDDVAGQFSAVTEKKRWFAAVASTKVRGKSSQDPFKDLEGKPESLRLTGLVKSGDKTYALFLPLIATAGNKTSLALRQLAEGDTLIGEWKIKTISANQVDIQQGEEIRSLKMYQPRPK